VTERERRAREEDERDKLRQQLLGARGGGDRDGRKGKDRGDKGAKGDDERRQKDPNAVGAAGDVRLSVQKAAQNLEKMNEVADKSENLQEEATNFASMAKKLKEKQKNRWF